jgi:hypothetical protein
MMAVAAGIIVLDPETVRAFDAYVRAAKIEIDDLSDNPQSFLWPKASLAKLKRVHEGEIVAQLWAGDAPVAVPHGLIHDWIGATFVPNATTADIVSVVQDYDDHKNIYSPDVVDSKLISHKGNEFKIYLRLLKKKIVTVVLDTEHAARYEQHGASWSCRSRTTRIAEVHDAGKASETTLPPDTGHGFLWRLYSFWKFQQMNEGALMQCRAISLTRDIPGALKWMIQPIVRSLPKDSLVDTLSATRRGVLQNLTAEARHLISDPKP